MATARQHAAMIGLIAEGIGLILAVITIVMPARLLLGHTHPVALEMMWNILRRKNDFERRLDDLEREID